MHPSKITPFLAVALGCYFSADTDLIYAQNPPYHSDNLKHEYIEQEGDDDGDLPITELGEIKDIELSSPERASRDLLANLLEQTPFAGTIFGALIIMNLRTHENSA